MVECLQGAKLLAVLVHQIFDVFRQNPNFVKGGDPLPNPKIQIFWCLGYHVPEKI